jgi:hypothetical protein
MSYSKHGVKVLGLSLIAALGLMAVSAAGAQAQTGWLVGGAFIGATQGVEGEIHPLNATEKHLVLSGEALGAKVKILCKALAVDDGLLFANEAAEGLATLLYSTCETFLNGSLSAVCKPAEPITANVKFKAILHNSLTYLLFEPDNSTVFTNLKFPNAGCLLKPERPIAGSFVVECLTEELKTMTEDPEKRDLCLTDLVNHLIKEASPQSLFGTDGLTFAGKPATLEGIAKVFLSGANKGGTWAVHI